MGITAANKARSGTREWMFQRIANLSIVLWGVVFIALVLTMGDVNYTSWQALFNPVWFKLYSSLTLLLVGLNSVLAGWQIAADYVKVEAANKIFMVVCVLGSVAYVVLGLVILWF